MKHQATYRIAIRAEVLRRLAALATDTDRTYDDVLRRLMGQPPAKQSSPDLTLIDRQLTTQKEDNNVEG
ncbi:hypothetical protein FB566_0877 [Stackebrandtia endophytica]|uniref:Uncharacterized protein n=1 Tax=Stackebrandtia endophytica TaxID=1496996 RepID=A0A543AS47_9ACTN|nr:hypothetical protein [Stackebrandtia endophytica]TQL75376.1 hypothetical protein FB566_0877 [Stackebrandtia endophytica]